MPPDWRGSPDQEVWKKQVTRRIYSVSKKAVPKSVMSSHGIQLRQWEPLRTLLLGENFRPVTIRMSSLWRGSICLIPTSKNTFMSRRIWGLTTKESGHTNTPTDSSTKDPLIKKNSPDWIEWVDATNHLTGAGRTGKIIHMGEIKKNRPITEPWGRS